MSRCKELFANGTRKSHVVYGVDGKTATKGELYRPDGTLRLSYERLSDARRVRGFLPNSKHPFYIKDYSLDNTKAEKTFFRDDQTI